MPSITINSTVLTFNNIWYVSNDGDDSTGVANDPNLPLKTINSAVTKCSSGDAIYIEGGIYNTYYDGGTYSSATLYDANKAITFIGVAGKTILRSDKTVAPLSSYRDFHVFRFQNSQTRCINIIFDVKWGTTTTTYSTALFCLNANDSCYGDIYNCVIISDVANGGSYCNRGTCYATMNNCLIITAGNMQQSYSGRGFVAINCACNYSLYNENTRTNCYNNVTYDSNYKITLNGEPISDVGVFSGDFSWHDPVKYLLRDNSSIYYLSNNEWECLGSNPPTLEMFNTYGMVDSIPSESIQEFDSPEIIAVAQSQPSLSTEIPSKEIYYTVSTDGTTWKSFIGEGWQTVSDIYESGMSKAQIESLTTEQLQEFYTPGNLYVRALMKSNKTGETPNINQVTVNFPDTYPTGGKYITTSDTMQLNTSDWVQINSCNIVSSQPSSTNIRIAFSNNGRNSWKVFRNGVWTPINSLNDVVSQGNTVSEIRALTSSQWQPLIDYTLDIAVCLITTDPRVTPSLDQITFTYDQVPSSLSTLGIEIPVPEIGFREVLNSDRVTYTLKMAEGIAFDDSTTDYDFYTTPDKIKLRSLSFGNVVGGHQSQIKEVEIINGYDNKDFMITLKVQNNGIDADIIVAHDKSYALLHDSSDEDTRTVVELSLNGALEFTPVYPLTFRLNRQQRKLFFIRVTPTLITGGNVTYQIAMTGQPI